MFLGHLFTLYVCFCDTDHVMFFREFAFCLYMYYAYIDSEVDARAWDEIWKKKSSLFSEMGKQNLQAKNVSSQSYC